MTIPLKPSFPFLLYLYPWMPFPRRLILYLREKRIPPTLVRPIRVSDPGDGNTATDPSVPARPPGSLPILAIPHAGSNGSQWTYIRQSMAIIDFLEDMCERGQHGFTSPTGPLMPLQPLERAREREILTLAEELTVGWNPVRMFGTGAGTMSFPQGAREMLRWERRALLAIETCLAERERPAKRDDEPVTVAEIALYQFLEFTKDCYGVDMTVGSGETVADVYGREVKEDFPQLREFYLAFAERESAKRDVVAGEMPGDGAAKAMGTWAEGVL